MTDPMALDALKVFAVGPVGKLQRVRAAKKPFRWPKQGRSERLAATKDCFSDKYCVFYVQAPSWHKP